MFSVSEVFGSGVFSEDQQEDGDGVSLTSSFISGERKSRTENL